MSMVDILAKALLGPNSIDEALEMARNKPEQINSKLDYVLEDHVNFVKRVLIESTLKGNPNALIPVIVIEVATGKDIGNPDYLLEALKEDLDAYNISLTEGNKADDAFVFEIKPESSKTEDNSEKMMKAIEAMVTKAAKKGESELTITNETMSVLVDDIDIDSFVVSARKRFTDWTISHVVLKHEHNVEYPAIQISWV